MSILQVEIPTSDIEELTNSIHEKHAGCQLDNAAVEKNAIRILQSYKHILWGEIFGSFEPVKRIMNVSDINGEMGFDITEEMKGALWNEDWSLTTRRMLANSWYGTFIGLRKIIEKRDEAGNISNRSKKTSSITVITQKFETLLNPHTKKDKSIDPFLKNLKDATEELIQMRTKIDPITDKFIAHIETNSFSEISNNLPEVKEIQDCIALCESYYQIIYSFYQSTHYAIHHLKHQISLDLWRFVEALRVSAEYGKNRDEIKAIIFNEKSISKRNEEIAKRLMKIIEPRLYEGMCISER